MRQLLVCLVAILLATVAHLTPASAAAPRPNIVFFLIDDLGNTDVSFHGGEKIGRAHV